MRVQLDIDAVQWFKDGDHPDVKLAGPTLYRRGSAAYIEGMWPLASAWVEYEPLTVEPEKPQGGPFEPMVAEFEHKVTGEKYWRRSWPFSRIWPFSFSEFNGEKIKQPIDTSDPFYQDCMMIESGMFDRRDPPQEHVPHGWLQPPATDGRLEVFPGDWIVMHGDVRQILSDADFIKTYGGPGTKS